MKFYLTKCFAFAFAVTSIHTAFAQAAGDTIKPETVLQHLFFLASDSLKGRGNHTPELHQAAYYISNVYKEAGLQFLPPLAGYFQPFSIKKIAPGKLLPDTAGRYGPDDVLLNVIAMLPGKKSPEEAVVFSAHFDHLGTGKGRDKIYNGANDNASGTAALLALAQYYALRNNNGRTLIFCAFAGEELGLRGSKVFCRNIKKNAIKAVINLEMLGSTSAVGKKSFFITGAHTSTFATIFKKNLKRSDISIKPEPDEEKQLFKRSDNYSFFLKGIPAHTIMSSDDGDECYHKACDEIKRIDVLNMTELVKAVATGSQSIIDGMDTPVAIK